MPPGRANAFLEFFRRSLPALAAATPDGELLARFATTGDADSFHALVQRHGPMVYGVARRLVGDAQRAEDVFQATFLVLSRKAGSLRRESALAAWLYRVVLRVANKAREQRPLPAITPPVAPDAADDAERREIIRLVDDAVARLPDKLRRAVVLCYFAGHTAEEAAQMLGCPRGTVLWRLSAARDRLRADLARRGLAVSIVTLTAVLAADCAPAAAPLSLVNLTVGVAT